MPALSFLPAAKLPVAVTPSLPSIVTKGRAPAAPLGPGETFTGPHRHANGDYYLSCSGGPLGRRQVSCRTADTIRADKVAQRFRNGDPIIDVRDVLIGPILDAVLASPRTGARERSMIKSLKKYWAKVTIGELDPARCKDFVHRARCVPKRFKRLGLSTLRLRLRRLFAWIRKAIARVDPDHKLETWMPPEGAARKRWLRRTEAARMLWAARGRIWNKRTNAWLVDAEGRRALRPRSTIEERRMIGRLILLGLYTGTRADAMFDCRWSAAHLCGYVNLKISIFYRQASGQLAESKQQPRVRLIPKLVQHMRGWERRDRSNPEYVATGTERVIHNGSGGPLTSVNVLGPWNSLREDAGLDTAVNRHTLRHTAATWLLESGCPDTDVADFLGITLITLHKKYAQIEGHFAKAAVAAFDMAVWDPEGRLARIAAAAAAKVKRSLAMAGAAL